MFACIPLNPCVLIEQWVQIGSKDQYLHWLVRKCTNKSAMFACIPLNPPVLIE